jgi:predicted permease
VNAANLMLARGSQRQREIAIRLAIGAARGRIVRQLLAESALLALLATAAALPLAWWGLQLASAPMGTPIPIDPIVLALTVVTAAVTTLAFGLLPALRVSAQRPSTMLGPAGAPSDAMPRQSRMRRLLVVAQVALSLGLLATAWQLVATVRSQAVSGGTPGDRLMIARFDLQPHGLRAGEADAFYRALLQGAVRLPGVEAAGLARQASVWTFGLGAGPASILVWRPADGPDDGQAVIGGYAGGELFEAVGLRVVAGRGFTDADRRARPQVAVVNETAAKQMYGPAVGTMIRVARRDQDFTSSIEVRVVGVIEPALEPRYTPDGPPPAKVYLPSPIEPEPALALYLRTRDTAATVAQPVRELVSRIDPRVPVKELGSLDEINERSYGYGPQLWLARAAVLVGILGLALATAGLYGVSSYVVALRSREMAIRIAIGATPRMILAMVVGQSMRMAAIGLVAGGAAAVAVSRFIQSEYHGIEGIDVTAFVGAVALFLAAMLVAGTIPAVRASRLDPVEHLKT